MGLEEESVIMALTPAEQAELDAARLRLGTINGGEAVKSVAHGSKRMETHAPDPAALERRVNELDAIARGGRRRGAIRFVL